MKGIFVICSNGFGHFRRSIRIATALKIQAPQLSLSIFCHPSQIAKLQKWDMLQILTALPNVEFYPLLSTPTWQTDPNFLNQNTLFDWYRALPAQEISDADFVISDNMPQILHINPNTILLGSFLWSEILIQQFPGHHLVKKFHDEELDLLNRYSPSMICLRDMAMPYVVNHTQPIFTDWIVEDTFERSSSVAIKNILLATGGTPHVLQEMASLAVKLEQAHAYNIYAPERVLQLLNDRNLQPFDFTLESFAKIDLMLARPGIGSLTDAVAYQIPVIALGETNPELRHNAQRIEILGYGINCHQDNVETVTKQVGQLNHSSTYSAMHENLKKAGKNGLQQCADFILSSANINPAIDWQTVVDKMRKVPLVL